MSMFPLVYDLTKQVDGLEQFPVYDLLVNVLGTVIGTALLATVSFLAIRFIRSRPIVKLVRRSNDKDLDSFLDLYETIIDEDTRISSEEIVSWIDEDRVARRKAENKIFHYLWLCKVYGKVIGFAKVIYHSGSRLLFVAYFGIDNENAIGRRTAAKTIIAHLRWKLTTDRVLRSCQGIVAECEKPDSNMPTDEKRRKKARIRLFFETSKRMSTPMYVVDFDYIQPTMPVGGFDETAEEKLALLYIPVKSRDGKKTISKNQLLSVVSFVYLNVYGPTYRHDKKKDKQYKRYLMALLGKYESSLPKQIRLLS